MQADSKAIRILSSFEEAEGAVGEIQKGCNVAEGSEQVSLGETIRILHQKKLNPKTLESLCLEFCSNKAYKMLAWHKRIDLPNFLKNKLLTYYPKTFDPVAFRCSDYNWPDLAELIGLLLNNETKELNFIKWYSFSVYWTKSKVGEMIKLLRLIRKKAPNLEKLSVCCVIEDDKEDTNYALQKRVVYEIMMLKNLKYLEVVGFFYFQSEDLKQLLITMPNLVMLKIHIDGNIQIEPILHLPPHEELQEFYFYVSEKYGVEKMVSLTQLIYSNCADNFPKLRLVGDITELNRELQFSALHAISPQIRGESQLEHLHAAAELPDAKLPNLKYLYLRGPFKENPNSFLGKLSSYGKLTHLILNSDDPRPILETIGHQLTSLHFGSTESVDYFEILFLCPNLKKMTQNSGKQCIAVSHFQNVIRTPTALVKVEARQSVRRPFTKSLIKTIFHSPEIQNVNLQGFIVGSDDMLSTDFLPKGLPCLKSLEMNDMQLADDCTMQQFADVITRLIVLAPRLENLTIDWALGTDLSARWDKYSVVKEYVEIVNKSGQMSDVDMQREAALFESGDEEEN